ncbi:TPA: hypothetical protein NG605_004319 [Vibrio parahaemolyticus]|nr:hypothetical protein [Vibrio parahaemolyticus]
MSDAKDRFYKELRAAFPTLNTEKMLNSYHQYKATLDAMSQGGAVDVKVTDFFNEVGGQFRYASFAYEFLTELSNNNKRQKLDRPDWFHMYLNKVNLLLEDSWGDIENHIATVISEKAAHYETLKESVSSRHEEHVSYIDELNSELQTKIHELSELEDKFFTLNESSTRIHAKLEAENQHLSTQISELKETITSLESCAKDNQVARDNLMKIEGQYAQLQSDYHMLLQNLVDTQKGTAVLKSSDSSTEEIPF